MLEAAQHTATRHELSLKPRHLTTYVDLPATAPQPIRSCVVQERAATAELEPPFAARFSILVPSPRGRGPGENVPRSRGREGTAVWSRAARRALLR
jgi:hypothetical protein